MIKREVFTKEYISKIVTKYNTDPQIVERSIFALGLLEAITISKLDFTFKGGSSLMILLEKPLRLSTDIDIIVKPGVDVLSYILKASKTYPFVRYEEKNRIGANNIVKKHFSFYYKSLSDSSKELPILLDIVFDDVPYNEVIKKEIKTEFLETDGEPVNVNVPSIESLLGDKLTAFAPNTIGVKLFYKNFNDKIIDKKIEVIKQFFDVASLIDVANNFNAIRNSYIKSAEAELGYRGLALTYKNCLLDTFNTCLLILSKGTIDPDNYRLYLEGIRGIRAYIINSKFTGETAYIQASKIMYLVACLIANEKPENKFKSDILLEGKYSKLNKIKKLDEKSFNLIAASIEIIENYKTEF